MEKSTIVGLAAVVILLFAVIKKYEEVGQRNVSLTTEIFGGTPCLGGTKFAPGDVSGDRIYYTKGVTEEQCRMACGSKKAFSWAHSDRKECFCGEGPAKSGTSGEYRAGNCKTAEAVSFASRTLSGKQKKPFLPGQ